ncbi:hypothetical protein ANANG_G00313590, partial [Anguilla anguilla]
MCVGRGGFCEGQSGPAVQKPSRRPRRALGCAPKSSGRTPTTSGLLQTHLDRDTSQTRVNWCELHRDNGQREETGGSRAL